MKTLPILNSMLVLASGAGFSAQQANAQQKPHIILIMSDQHRADALGCMGNESVISPNIDQLSREGTLFCNGYSSTPSSTPGTRRAIDRYVSLASRYAGLWKGGRRVQI